MRLIRLRGKCVTGCGGSKEDGWNNMFRRCLGQTSLKRNTVERKWLYGQCEVAENRVFADNMPSACVRADFDTLKQSLAYRHIVCLAYVQNCVLHDGKGFSGTRNGLYGHVIKAFRQYDTGFPVPAYCVRNSKEGYICILKRTEYAAYG